MITKTFTSTEYGHTSTSEAYTRDGKVWHWTSNDAPCPLDACQDYGIPVDQAAQERALDAYYARVIGEYRKARKNGPTAEERAEARAAHGRGVKLVDVFTGHTWTT